MISCILSSVITITLQASTRRYCRCLYPGIYRTRAPLLKYVTWLLVSDILRGTSRAACAGHDIAGPGLHVEVRVLACR